MGSSKVLLDASAYIAYMNKEPGYEVIKNIINTASINTITYTEIISFYAKLGVNESVLKELCTYVDIINVNQDICFIAGDMIRISKEYGLSLGDRLCLSSAMYFRLDVYTSDKIWLKLSKKLQLNIIAIR